MAECGRPTLEHWELDSSYKSVIRLKEDDARVGDGAVEELRNAIEAIAFEISTQAMVSADKEGRLTVKGEDVRSAAIGQRWLKPFISPRKDTSPLKKL